jgi:hypothetical protein
MTAHCALVEGPTWADTKFYAKWLLSAAQANELWTEALNDPQFSNRIDRLTFVYIPDFNIGATVLLSGLKQNFVSLVIKMNGDEESEHFAMMIEMGFFVLTGQRYQMVIPRQLTLELVKNAALALAETEDEDSHLHPENIITTMPYTEGKAWQSRLRGMDEARRHADRLLLLDVYPDTPSPVPLWECR